MEIGDNQVVANNNNNNNNNNNHNKEMLEAGMLKIV